MKCVLFRYHATPCISIYLLLLFFNNGQEGGKRPGLVSTSGFPHHLMLFVQGLLSWNALSLVLAASVIRALQSWTLQLQSVCQWGHAPPLISSPKSRHEFCVSIAPLSLFSRRKEISISSPYLKVEFAVYCSISVRYSSSCVLSWPLGNINILISK